MPHSNGTKHIIVTTNPLPSEEEEFWDIVLSEDVKVIVILLKNVGVSVITGYWPLDGSMTFGSIKITLKSKEGDHEMKYNTDG